MLDLDPAQRRPVTSMVTHHHPGASQVLAPRAPSLRFGLGAGAGDGPCPSPS